MALEPGVELPELAVAYFGRGVAREDQGGLEGANRAYRTFSTICSQYSCLLDFRQFT